MKNKTIIITIIALLIVGIIISVSSYAYLEYTTSQDDVNKYTAACYDITYEEEVEGVTLKNYIPVSDARGLRETPYTITLTNNCKKSLSYTALMHIMDTSTTDESLIRVGVNDEVSNLVDNTLVDATLENTKHAYILKNGSLTAGQSVTLNFRAWMSSEVLDDQGENTQFENKISIDVGV